MTAGKSLINERYILLKIGEKKSISSDQPTGGDRPYRPSLDLECRLVDTRIGQKPVVVSGSQRTGEFIHTVQIDLSITRQ